MKINPDSVPTPGGLCAWVDAPVCTHMDSHMYINTHKHIHAHTYITHTHNLSLSHSHTHTHTHAHTQGALRSMEGPELGKKCKDFNSGDTGLP